MKPLPPSRPTARHKLNSAVISGITILAGLLGLVTQSWGVFFVAFAVLAACSLLDKSLRL